MSASQTQNMLPLPGVSSMLSRRPPIFTIVSQELASARCTWSLILVVLWFLVNHGTCTGSQFDSEPLQWRSFQLGRLFDRTESSPVIKPLVCVETNQVLADKLFAMGDHGSSSQKVCHAPPHRLGRVSAKCILLISHLGRYFTFLDVTVFGRWEDGPGEAHRLSGILITTWLAFPGNGIFPLCPSSLFCELLGENSSYILARTTFLFLPIIVLPVFYLSKCSWVNFWGEKIMI